MTSKMHILWLAACMAVAACNHTKPRPTPAPPLTTTHLTVELPPTQCARPAEGESTSARQAANWKRYALKLERLLGISQKGETP